MFNWVLFLGSVVNLRPQRETTSIPPVATFLAEPRQGKTEVATGCLVGCRRGRTTRNVVPFPTSLVTSIRP
jgi:hypothetical protein